MITLERLKNAIADIKADDEWVNDSHTHAKYRGVCEGLDMLIEYFNLDPKWNKKKYNINN